jgi:NitT/TauT family transport system permease protein
VSIGQPAVEIRRSGVRGMAGVGLALAGVAVTGVAWWLATDVFGLVHPVVLPPPGLVWQKFAAQPGNLLEHTGITTLEIVVGFAISTVVGMFIGVGLAASSILERMFSPLLVALNAVPKIAFAPLLVVALGWGQKPILTMVFLLCFFPIVLSTAVGLTTTPSDLAELARSLDCSRWQTFRKVRLPAALPQIFVGLKVGMPLASIGAVIGEFDAGERGLGFVIVQTGGLGDSATAWAAILLVALVSILLYYSVVLLELVLVPWVRETTSRR